MDDRSHVYARFGELDLTIETVLPPNAKDVPAVVFFHGGGWRQGRPQQFQPQARALARQGTAGLLASYRMIRKMKDPATHEAAENIGDCVSDAATAYAWARSHAKELGIDPDRISLGGGSAGGHLAAAVALCTDSPAPKALLLFNPVLNLDDKWTYAGPAAVRAKHSPLQCIAHAKALPPTLILQGKADDVTPPEVAKAFRDAYVKAGGTCELRLYDDVGHGFFNQEASRDVTIDAMLEFMRAQKLLGSPS